MPQTPGALGRRYLPFLALAAVQVLLVAIAPSKVPGTSAATSLSAGPQSGVAGQALDQNGQPTQGGLTRDANGNLIDANGNIVSSANGPSTGVSPTADMSKCDKNGRQIGPPGYKLMPPCVPVWHGGDNGGSTMTGVTKDAINFIVYVTQGNAEVNAILATQ